VLLVEFCTLVIRYFREYAEVMKFTK